MNNNIKTALAGTNLKIAMLRLSANPEAKKYLKDPEAYDFYKILNWEL